MNFQNLPEAVLLEIFEYLPYDEVSKKRLVCRRIDQLCQNVLNRGFHKVVRQHTLSFKRIKSRLPRRESERRNHFLARHADILTSIETRISMLSMTYCKYMDMNLCCFIPGRVLDEIQRILRLIAKTTKPLRPHEVLQELRDISSMAIEHFDEKIANTLKRSFVDGRSIKIPSDCSGSGSHSSDTSSSSSCRSNLNIRGWGSAVTTHVGGSSLSSATCVNALQQRAGSFSTVGADDMHKTDEDICRHSGSAGVAQLVTTSTPDGGCAEARALLTQYKKLEIEHKKGVVKMQRMQQIQMHHSRRMQQAMNTIADLSVQVIELKKRLEDVDAKNREISANIKQINTGEPATAAFSGATEDVNVTVTETTLPATVVEPLVAQDKTTANAIVAMNVSEFLSTSPTDLMLVDVSADSTASAPPLADIALSTSVLKSTTTAVNSAADASAVVAVVTKRRRAVTTPNDNSVVPQKKPKS